MSAFMHTGAEACWNFGTYSNPIQIEIEGQCITDPDSAVQVDKDSFCLTITGRASGYYQFVSGDISGTIQTSYVNTDTGIASICLSLSAKSDNAMVAVAWHEGGVSSAYSDLGAFNVNASGGNTSPSITKVTNEPKEPNNADDITITVNATDSDGDSLSYTWSELSGPTGDISSRLALCSGSSCTLSPLPPGSYSVKISMEDGKGGTDTQTYLFTVSERVKVSCSYDLDAGIKISYRFTDLFPSQEPALSTKDVKVYMDAAQQGFTIGNGTKLQSNPFDILLNHYYRENQEAKEYQGTTLIECATDRDGRLKADFFLNFGKMASNLAVQYWPTPGAPIILPIRIETDTPFAVNAKLDVSLDRIANLRSIHVVERPGCKPGTIDCTAVNALLPHASDRTQPYSEYRTAANDFTKRVTLEDASRWLGNYDVTLLHGVDDLRLTGGTKINLDARDFSPVQCSSCEDAYRADKTLEPYWLVISANFLDGVIGSVGLSSDSPGTYSIEIGKRGSESFTGWTYWRNLTEWIKGQSVEKAVEKAIPVLGPAMAVKEVVEIIGTANTYQRTKFMRLNSAVRIFTDNAGQTFITTREGEVDIYLEGDTSGIGSVSAGETGIIPYDEDKVTILTSTEEEIDAADDSLSTLKDMAYGRTLSMTRDGTGAGTVTSSPTGIDCGEDCTELYISGTTVTLTATADSGSSFAGWSGDCSGDSLTMDADTTCTATFNLTEPGGNKSDDGGGGGCFITTAGFGS